MLYIIGIGIRKDYLNCVSIEARLSLKECGSIYLLSSNYHPVFQAELEEELDLKCTLVMPNLLRQFLQTIGKSSGDTALLVPGNAFCDNLYPLIASVSMSVNLSFKIIHNTCYLNAFGNAGIQLYKIGEVILLKSCNMEDLDSCYEPIAKNLRKYLNPVIIPNCIYKNAITSVLKGIAEGDHGIFGDVLNTSTKAVVLHRQTEGGDILFHCGTIQDLLKFCESHNVEAICFCSSFDCVEDEYLRTLSRLQLKRRMIMDLNKGCFNVIGLGLGSPNDITGRGMQLVEESDKVFLEGYTSIMIGGKDGLEKFHKKDIIVADREMVEQNSDEILGLLKEGMNISLLVVGDPLGATTHQDIILRSLEKTSNVEIVNNASIINVYGLCGLKPQKFGGIVSIPFWANSYKPDSFCDKISSNLESGWHTLCLLDIQVKEQSFENLARGRKIYEKPRYMSPAVAAQQLLESIEMRKDDGTDCKLTSETKTISLSRLGTGTEKITFLPLSKLVDHDFGAPLHSLVIVSSLDEEEKFCLEMMQR